ncbi:hypothetical protein ACNENL_002389 [Escherichia fergusonii]
MKDVYEPDNEDIYEWLNSRSYRWPESDWDYYVLNGKNDLLIFKLANDQDCFQRLFFIHALYYLVGDYYHSGMTDYNKHKRIIKLISKVNDDCCPEIIKWKNETINLLSNKSKFNIEYWLHHMF